MGWVQSSLRDVVANADGRYTYRWCFAVVLETARRRRETGPRRRRMWSAAARETTEAARSKATAPVAPTAAGWRSLRVGARHTSRPAPRRPPTRPYLSLALACSTSAGVAASAPALLADTCGLARLPTVPSVMYRRLSAVHSWSYPILTDNPTVLSAHQPHTYSSRYCRVNNQIVQAASSSATNSRRYLQPSFDLRPAFTAHASNRTCILALHAACALFRSSCASVRRCSVFIPIESIRAVAY